MRLGSAITGGAIWSSSKVHVLNGFSMKLHVSQGASFSVVVHAGSWWNIQPLLPLPEKREEEEVPERNVKRRRVESAQLAQFAAVTGITDPKVGEFFLDQAEGDAERAINLHLSGVFSSYPFLDQEKEKEKDQDNDQDKDQDKDKDKDQDKDKDKEKEKDATLLVNVEFVQDMCSITVHCLEEQAIARASRIMMPSNIDRIEFANNVLEVYDGTSLILQCQCKVFQPGNHDAWVGLVAAPGSFPVISRFDVRSNGLAENAPQEQEQEQEPQFPSKQPLSAPKQTKTTDEKEKQFMAFTNTSVENARAYLEKNGNNVESAINEWLLSKKDLSASASSSDTSSENNSSSEKNRERAAALFTFSKKKNIETHKKKYGTRPLET
jgi:hypothetical protein